MKVVALSLFAEEAMLNPRRRHDMREAHPVHPRIQRRVPIESSPGLDIIYPRV
jgi:hypothetical protein